MSNFEREFGTAKVGFLIRKFEERNDRSKLVALVRDTFRNQGLIIKDALEKTLNPETWQNVKEYLDNCAYGVVLIDNLSPEGLDFNPNVFLEIGYLMARGKHICIIIQNSLAKRLPTDIKPFIYIEFDSQDIDNNFQLKHKIDCWIQNTINHNPGHIAIYLKGGIANTVDILEKIREYALAMSSCSVVEYSKILTPKIAELELLKLDKHKDLSKIILKTSNLEMANNFVVDLANGRYGNFPIFYQYVIYARIDASAIAEEYADGGITYVLDDEKQLLTYCENSHILDIPMILTPLRQSKVTPLS